jgi:hypothetical protein
VGLVVRGTSDASIELMFPIVTQRSFGWFTGIPLLAITACSSAPDDSQNPTGLTAVVAEGLGAVEEGECSTVAAGDGWMNSFMPQSTGTFSVRLRGYPSGHSIDTVVGLSDGPADAFSDLGPIVRFNANGNIDARDGDQYVGGFPYTFGVGPFEFQMDVSIPTHRYTVFVRHLDSPYKTFELLGENLRFRTQQSGVTRLDNVGRFTDAAAGDLETCGFLYTGPAACTASQAGSWASRAFPSRSGAIRIEFTATASAGSIDAVIGASNGAPAGFSSLAPIVRFRPDGTFDARNGSAYGAVETVPYVAGAVYRIALDIDTPNHRYSAMVRDANQHIYDSPYVTFARDYAFRTEQAGVAALDHVAQFVDGTPGSLSVCNLTVAY